MRRREMARCQTTHGLHVVDDAASTTTGEIVGAWCGAHDAGAMPLKLVRRALRRANYGEDPADDEAKWQRMRWADEELLDDLDNPAAGLRVVELSAVELAR